MGGGYTTGRKLTRWTDEEYEFMMTQFKAGHKFADIANQMNRKFGTDRTKNGVGQRIGKFIHGQMPKNILEKFKPQNGIKIPQEIKDIVTNNA